VSEAERPRISARTEKGIRLAGACIVASGFGIAAVATDDETLGFVGIGIVLAAILAGPIVTRALGIGR
jgi:hypothetical protein